MHKWIKGLLTVIVYALIFMAGILIGKNTVEEKQDTEVKDPYTGSVKNADVLIQVPSFRQYSTYTCGTTCVQMLMNWAFPQKGDINLADLEKELGSTDEGGTTPQNILKYFNTHDVNASMHQNMNVNDLIESLDNGHPVVTALQAWSTAEDGSYNTTDSANTDTYLIEGHYVICTGYQKADNGYILYFNDPANTGLCTMTNDELDKRWIDMDASGNVYDHTGIIVNMNTDYNPYGTYHLD